MGPAGETEQCRDRKDVGLCGGIENRSSVKSALHQPSSIGEPIIFPAIKNTSVCKSSFTLHLVLNHGARTHRTLLSLNACNRPIVHLQNRAEHRHPSLSHLKAKPLLRLEKR